MRRRFERSTLRAMTKQYDGTYNYRRLVVLGVVLLLASLVLTRVGLGASPNAVVAYFGGFGLMFSLTMLLTGLQGPILSRYMDTDRMLDDLREPHSSPIDPQVGHRNRS